MHNGLVPKREASALSKRVGKLLKADGLLNDWTAKDVERKTDWSYSTITRMLNGESEISIDDLMQFAAVTGANAFEIIAEAEKKMPADYRERLMSQAPDNVTVLHDTDWDTYEGRKAATNDEEASEDEPAGP